MAGRLMHVRASLYCVILCRQKPCHGMAPHPSSPTNCRMWSSHSGGYKEYYTFWDIRRCSPLVNRRFRGTYRLHLQGRRISQARNQRESMWQADPMLGLFFNPEDGGDIVLRNVGWLSTEYTALYPRRQCSSVLLIVHGIYCFKISTE
jgi:hypothetical protein